MPGVGALKRLIDIVDVFDAGGVEPVFKCVGTLLGVDGDAVFPCGAPAKDSVEARAGFDGELESFDEDGVRDAG